MALKRTPLKRGNKPLRKVSPKKQSKRKGTSKDMWDFFLEIWNERPHQSELSRIHLGNEPLSYMFDHLLEKSKYPELAYDKRNIILVTLQEHDAKTRGFPSKRHAELIEKAKKELLCDEILN